MASPDLLEIEKRVNETRQAFLDALDACANDDVVGREIADTYLKKFIDDVDSRRADIAREHAREAAQLVHDFAHERATVASHVDLINQRMQVSIATIQVAAIATIMAVKVPETSPPHTDPTAAALAMVKGFTDGTKKAIEQAQTESYEKAASVGERVIHVQVLATMAILMRHATYSAFRREKLDARWSDLSARITTQLKEESKDQLIQKSWDIALDVAAAIGDIVIEELSLLHKIPKYFKRLAAVVGVREADTQAGGTDDMMKLLAQLRSERQLLHGLDTAFRSAMDDMARLGKTS